MPRHGRAPLRHPHRLSVDRYEQIRQPVFFTLATHRRRPFLTRDGVPETVLGIFDDSAIVHRCALIAYCLMPDHVHLLTCVVEEGGSVKACIDSAKALSGHALTRLGLSAPIWQRSYFDRHVRGHEDVAEVVSYILRNPVEAGLCKSADDWPFSGFRGWPPRTAKG